MNRALTAIPLVLALAACRHVPDERQRENAKNYYDLGLQAQASGDAVAAYKELEKSLQLDPGFAQAHNAMGILLHLSFRRLDEATTHYRKALELDPRFSDVHTNLGNIYLELERYDDAIAEYRKALDDILYTTPYIAEANIGWALYKKGEVEPAIRSIKAAVARNPGFCLGHRNLGIIQDEQDQPKEALKHFGRYREACPQRADAYLHEGLAQAKVGQVDAARDSFAQCEEKASALELKDQCRSLAEKLQ
ncbi:MAG: social motility TPR repeat lipoprotein Tgl [Myxococcaceae bacterium]|nr:social motility TPR repeat lipoprotein Tgl [Myxococcaceae bacterium]